MMRSCGVRILIEAEMLSLSYRLVTLIAALLLPSGIASAQIPPLTGGAAPAAQPEKDPLGRDTPRGTVLGFMRASRDGNEAAALMYLNTTLKGQAAVVLARQLYVVLDSRLPARLTELSDLPEGAVANPLKPDQDVVVTVETSEGQQDLIVERVPQSKGPGPPIWQFSRATLQAVPEIYESVKVLPLDPYLPDVLTQNRFLGVRLFAWLTLAILLPLGYRLLGLLGWFVGLVWRRFHAPSVAVLNHFSGPVRLVLLAFLIRAMVGSIETRLAERQFWSVITAGLAIAGGVWLALRFNDYGERYAYRRLEAAGLAESIGLLRLGRRMADVLAIAVGILIAIRYLGADPTAALAGLGIGGIAVALAAQKTLENVIGGLSLVIDKAVRVGDVVKLGETVGTVDYVGLRSTRLRTTDRTIFVVPNGQIATANIETLSLRDKFWFRHIVGLRYETTAEQMRAVIASARQLLLEHPLAELDSVRVRFIRLGQSSRDVELFAYKQARAWPHFLEVQEELLLRVMGIVEEAGTAIAFPSQTVYAGDGGLPASVERVLEGQRRDVHVVQKP
jgi:MscS family membrane protein